MTERRDTTAIEEGFALLDERKEAENAELMAEIWRLRQEKKEVAHVLRLARAQIEGMHLRLEETASGNRVLGRIDDTIAALAAYRETR